MKPHAAKGKAGPNRKRHITRDLPKDENKHTKKNNNWEWIINAK